MTRPAIPLTTLCAALLCAALSALSGSSPAAAAQGCSSTTTTVGTPAELDAAIECFNTQQPAGAHVITFSAAIAHPTTPPPVTLDGDETTNLLIDGAGHELAGTASLGSDPLLTIAGTAPVEIRSLTIRDSGSDAITAASGTDLHVANSTVDGNTSGINSAGRLTIFESTVSNSSGTAITISGGPATMENSTVIDNAATSVEVVAGTLLIRSSTVTLGNRFRNLAVADGAALLVSNSTFDGALIVDDGGIAEVANTTAYSVVEAPTGGSGYVRFTSSILDKGANRDLCTGDVVDGGGNFVFPAQDFGSCPFTEDVSYQFLGELAENGGPTPTRALPEFIDPVDGGICQDVPVGFDELGNVVTGDLEFDQRGVGFPRTVGPMCDAGSFETSEAPMCDGKQITIFWGPGAVATHGDDVIYGTADADEIDALGGNDTVCGRSGDDVIIGGDGDDRIFGAGGNDIARGNAGNDLLDGGFGDDRLLGGVGGDQLFGGNGDDFLGGYGGDDTIRGGSQHDTIYGGYGADTIYGDTGNDVIHGLIGNDFIDGGVGHDVLHGDRGSDTILGSGGADVIHGGNGNDALFGGHGYDELNGGRADDTLSGGTEIDTCVGNKHYAGDFADGTCEKIFGVP